MAAPAPVTPAKPPRQFLDFSSLRAEDAVKLRRIVRRQPHHMPILLRTINKTVLRRFLRTNNKRYRSRDKKDRIVELVAAMVRERGLVEKVKPPPRKLMMLGEHYPDMKCLCPVSYNKLIAERPVNMNRSFRDALKLFVEKSTAAQLEKELRNLGVKADVCRVQNLMALRDLYEDNFLQQKTLVQDATLDAAPDRLESECVTCCVHEACVLLKPCGHVATCVECVVKLGRVCPFCRVKYETCMIYRHSEASASEDMSF